jgi:hypothetical protein
MACVRGSRARGARRGGGAAGAADVDTSTVSGLSRVVSTYSPRELPPKRVLDLLLFLRLLNLCGPEGEMSEKPPEIVGASV